MLNQFKQENKMKNIIKLLFFILLVSNIAIFAQIDNNFQKFYADIQKVLAKDIESLTTSDLNLLNETIKLNANYFGAANQKLTQKAIQDAKNKKLEYENWLKTKQNLEETKQNLAQTTEALQESIARGDSLYAENVQLKELIEQLTKRVKLLEREAARLEKVNKSFKEEAIQTKYLLEQSRTAVQRIMRLLPNPAAQNNELLDQVPGTLQDSLNQSECQIAELIKNNFIITLESVKKDQAFLDSARVYFSENKTHLPVVESYFNEANELINRFKELNTPCTSNYASEIEIAITELRSLIEMTDNSFGQKLAKFVSENLLIVIILLIAIAVLIFLLAKKNKNNNSTTS